MEIIGRNTESRVYRIELAEEDLHKEVLMTIACSAIAHILRSRVKHSKASVQRGLEHQMRHVKAYTAMIKEALFDQDGPVYIIQYPNRYSPAGHPQEGWALCIIAVIVHDFGNKRYVDIWETPYLSSVGRLSKSVRGMDSVLQFALHLVEKEWWRKNA